MAEIDESRNADDVDKGGDSGGRQEPQGDETDPLHALLVTAREAVEHFLHMIDARADLVRSRVHGAITSLVAGVVVVAIATVVVVFSTAYVVQGAAGGVSDLTGTPPWVGRLVAGALGIATVGGLLAIGAWRARVRRMRMRVEKYEKRKQTQRVRFGRDTDEAARDAA